MSYLGIRIRCDFIHDLTIRRIIFRIPLSKREAIDGESGESGRRGGMANGRTRVECNPVVEVIGANFSARWSIESLPNYIIAAHACQINTRARANLKIFQLHMTE